MEDLNKNQIILLTLLVSFVTSIATGIMTSTLLQEAPIEVTRNINRIVEKTIETVVPATPSAPATEKEVTTVIVKEEDLVLDSIDKNVKSIVRIKVENPFTDEIFFYGIGIIVTKDGLIVSDRKPVTTSHNYTATLSDGSQVKIIPQNVDGKTNFVAFKVSVPEKLTDKEKAQYVFSGAVLSEGDAKLGQTVISLGGEVSNAVSVGRVISFDMKESGTASSTVKYISGINTDVATKDLVLGSPVFNLSGDIIGVKLSSDPLRSFTPVSVLRKELPSLPDPAKPTAALETTTKTE